MCIIVMMSRQFISSMPRINRIQNKNCNNQVTWNGSKEYYVSDKRNATNSIRQNT